MTIQVIGALCLLVSALFTWSFINSFRKSKSSYMGEREWAEFAFEAISIWIWLGLGLLLITF